MGAVGWYVCVEGGAGDLVGGGAYGLSEVLGTADPLVPYGWYGTEFTGVTEGT